MKVASAFKISSEWLRTGEGDPAPGNEPEFIPDHVRRRNAIVHGQRLSPARELLPPTEADLLRLARLNPFFRAVDSYLELLHQELPLSRRMALTTVLISQCQALGLESPDELTLEELHASLSKEVFG